MLYPYTPHPDNKAAIKMYTEEEIKKNNYTVRLSNKRYRSGPSLISLSPLVLR